MIEAIVTLALLGGSVTFPLDEWRGDTALEIADAYKWIYQATEGGEHAAPSRAEAAAWLEREWATLGAPLAGEPLVEPLGDTGIVRLHLRPFRARGGDPAALVDAFLASAADVRPDPERFSREWRALGDELGRGPIGRLTRAAWEALDAETAPRGYPAVHHSGTYERARRPAYRVLTAERARALVHGLGRPTPASFKTMRRQPPATRAEMSAMMRARRSPPG